MKSYFNPSSSKRRNAVSQIDDEGKNYELVHYRESELSTKEIGDIIDILQHPLKDLVRRKRKFRVLSSNADNLVGH